MPVDRPRRASGALAKLAAPHRLPAFLSAVPPGGAFLTELLAPLGHSEPAPDTLAAGHAMQVAAERGGDFTTERGGATPGSSTT